MEGSLHQKGRETDFLSRAGASARTSQDGPTRGEVAYSAPYVPTPTLIQYE